MFQGKEQDQTGEGQKKGKKAAVEDDRKNYSYRDTPLHRILPGYYILGGDVVNQDGSSGSSIHGGQPFPDEKNDLVHNEPGLCSNDLTFKTATRTDHSLVGQV